MMQFWVILEDEALKRRAWNDALCPPAAPPPPEKEL